MGTKAPTKKKLALVAVGISFISLSVVYGISVFRESNKTEIKTSEIHDVARGTVKKGKNVSSKPNVISTNSNLTYVSEEIEAPQDGANAAVLKWGQSGGEEGVSVELRTLNDGEWSNWYLATGSDDRKDNTPVSHAALVVGTDISKIQYRFNLSGEAGESSPQINLSDASIEMIDSTKGPSPTKPKSRIEQLLSRLNPIGEASARMDGPRIISRTEWGSPEGENSPRWDAEYRPLSRVIVHHTVTPSNADPSATIRAIWQFHANTNNWGDIGYNYLVDQGGNIFQGRAFDPNIAHNQKEDVVGGHAYGNNYATTGISALGDFTQEQPSNRMIDSIANIAAFKAANYPFNPSGIGTEGPNLIGHRNVGTTSCPGDILYARLQDIRRIGDLYYEPRAALNRFDLNNSGQGYDNTPSVSTNMIAGESKIAYFDLINLGDEVWRNDGTNPVVLGTDQPRDRVSQFVSNDWIGPNRAASFENKVIIESNGTKTLESSDTIEPGEIGRFSFTMTAPDRGSGSYREHFQLLSINREWFTRNLLLSTTINVTPKIYAWRPTAQHIYINEQKINPGTTTNLSPGQRMYLVIKAENNGNQTWYNTGQNPLRVGTSADRDRVSRFCDPSWINCSRPAVLEEASIAPGQIGTFGFWITAPATNTRINVNEYFSLVAEGREWINTGMGISWPISVSPL